MERERGGGTEYGWLPAAIALSVVIASAGCWSGRPARVAAPSVDPQAVQSAAFAAADADGDGRLVGEELRTIPAIAAGLSVLDADRDGAVAAAELLAWLDAVRASRVAISRVEVLVRRRGRPQAGATVRLVPEPCMGSGVKPAEGTTDADGIAPLTIPGSPYAGVNCGLYRVAVGAGVAATETKIGIAVGAGLPEDSLVILDLPPD